MSDDEKAILRRKIFGFVFQQFNLINSLTVLENVVMPMRFENLNSKKAEERGKFLIKQVGLDGKENNKISEISGGQMQRVACVLVKNPKVLFLDEPTSGLDPTGKMDFQILLKKLSKEGMTIFYSSHILGEVEDIAGRVGILYQGKLQKILEGKEIENVAEIYKEITAVRSEDSNSLNVLK